MARDWPDAGAAGPVARPRSDTAGSAPWGGGNAKAEKFATRRIRCPAPRRVEKNSAFAAGGGDYGGGGAVLARSTRWVGTMVVPGADALGESIWASSFSKQSRPSR